MVWQRFDATTGVRGDPPITTSIATEKRGRVPASYHVLRPTSIGIPIPPAYIHSELLWWVSCVKGMSNSIPECARY